MGVARRPLAVNDVSPPKEMLSLDWWTKEDHSQQIVDVANGGPISEFDIEQRLTLRRKLSGPKKMSREDVIEELREERQTLQEAKTKGIEIGDSEIDQAYADIARRMRMTPRQMDKAFADSGINLDSLRDSWRVDLARRALALQPRR